MVELELSRALELAASALGDTAPIYLVLVAPSNNSSDHSDRSRQGREMEKDSRLILWRSTRRPHPRQPMKTRQSSFDHSECAEFDSRALHEARDSSPVELGVPRAVPAGVQSASATVD